MKRILSDLVTLSCCQFFVNVHNSFPLSVVCTLHDRLLFASIPLTLSPKNRVISIYRQCAVASGISKSWSISMLNFISVIINCFNFRFPFEVCSCKDVYYVYISCSGFFSLSLAGCFCFCCLNGIVECGCCFFFFKNSGQCYYVVVACTKSSNEKREKKKERQRRKKERGW